MVDEKTDRIERVYTVPFGKAYEYIRTKRARRAVRILRLFLARHMKTDPEMVRISEQLNEFVWSRSMQKPPRKIKIKVVKENGMVNASLPDEKPKKKRVVKKRGVKKEKKAKPVKAGDAKPEQKPDKKPPEKKAEEKKTESGEIKK